jgi:two-component system NtrC family sensor kinase
MAETAHRVVIVDDQEQNRYILSRLLQQAGYDCIQAANGKDAMAKIATLPDVAIIDVHLPDISGFTLCQQIKKNPDTAQVSVLQISASFVSAEDKAKALEAGADGYLTHPIDGVVLVATVRSLVRLRQAEVVAREAANQWQSTFDALSEGLAVISRDNKIARFNHAFELICQKYFPVEVEADALELSRALLGTDEPLRHPNPERYSADFPVGKKTMRVTVDRIGIRDEEMGKILVLADITDRKIAEYALRTAEKLAATGKLAHAIAHEINNPLEALINLIYLAQTEEPRREVKEYLTKANHELGRLSRIARQALSFHRDSEQPVPIDVGALIAEVVELYKRAAAARQICIECDSRATPSIYGFPGQLTQVFANLVRNATEASPPGAPVIIRVRPSHRADGEGVRVTVHDKGAGILPGVQEQMYDPFFTTKELKGSGLGLWVSKTLILNHHGTIRFRSSTRTGASGTTFEVFLPVKKE